MIDLLIPREDVNDDTVVIVKLLVQDGAEVEQDEPVCEAETTKTVFTIHSNCKGTISFRVSEGDELPVGGLLAVIKCTNETESNSVINIPKRINLPKENANANNQLGSLQLTKKAQEYANLHNVDLTKVHKRGIVTLADIQSIFEGGSFTPGLGLGKSVNEAKLATTNECLKTKTNFENLDKRLEKDLDSLEVDHNNIVNCNDDCLFEHDECLDECKDSNVCLNSSDNALYCHTPSYVKRVAILGAGMAAMQIIDVLLSDSKVIPVLCLDDNPELLGKSLFGVPVKGTTSLLEELWKNNQIDAAVVAVGTNLKVRHKLYTQIKNLGIPLVNAIDPTARINRQVSLGQGVAVLSFVHFGVCAQTGDNCFFAAHSNIDHHCKIGDSVLLGPGVLLSGGVTVGSNTIVGSGVIVQPGVKIGEGCKIASGSVIINDVPSGTTVKKIL